MLVSVISQIKESTIEPSNKEATLYLSIRVIVMSRLPAFVLPGYYLQLLPMFILSSKVIKCAHIKKGWEKLL